MNELDRNQREILTDTLNTAADELRQLACGLINQDQHDDGSLTSRDRAVIAAEFYKFVDTLQAKAVLLKHNMPV
jgi:hypothetical protein